MANYLIFPNRSVLYMEYHDLVIVGGGAAGIVAAISGKRKGLSVLVCEKMPRLGKKVLITGGGRCNLLNDYLDASCYNAEARELVRAVFDRFGKREILHFFEDLGLAVYSDGGRVFPATNQAASVVAVLEIELARLGIPVEYGCEISHIAASSQGFAVQAKNGKQIDARRLVLSGGGKTYPALGADGNCYALAVGFGHRVIDPVPSAVPLVVKDPWCHFLQGQKIQAVAAVHGKTGRRARGELLFTKYGLSGTAILDISEEISIAFHRHGAKSVAISIDAVPFLEKGDLHRELSRRLERGFRREDLLTGLLPHKFSIVLGEILQRGDVGEIVESVKNKRFAITGTRGWNEAEFTAGGVDTREIKPETLESRRQKGLYVAGEILDVQGPRGGYNLAWAWASGFLAGMAE